MGREDGEKKITVDFEFPRDFFRIHSPLLNNFSAGELFFFSGYHWPMVARVGLVRNVVHCAEFLYPYFLSLS